jgi:hypothetical protein
MMISLQGSELKENFLVNLQHHNVLHIQSLSWKNNFYQSIFKNKIRFNYKVYIS